MAKIVIAGSADCPYFAKCELLGDALSKNLSDFKLHKIVIQPLKWNNWLNETCDTKGWVHTKSPLVWRELVDRGGKGIIIGDANDFQEYVNEYYGNKSTFMSENVQQIGQENLKTKDELEEEEAVFKSLSKPLHVCITNASSDICYGMIQDLACGDVLGPNTEISLHLYDTDERQDYLEGVQMEAIDMGFPLLRDVIVTSNAYQAFTDCSIIVLLDSITKSPDADKSDWIRQNSALFTNYAKIIDEVAKPTVKVVVAGNGPVNFNTFMLIQNTTNVPRHNFVAMSRMVENNAKSILAKRLNVNSAFIVDTIVWGSANGTNIVDPRKARVHNYDGAIWGPPFYSRPLPELVHDQKWLDGEFLELVKKRRESVQESLKREPAFSHSAAIVSLLSHWWNGSPTGQLFSLGVCSEGWYGVPDGLVFSYPVTISPKGNWNVIQDIEVTDEFKEKLKGVIKELQQEKEVIFPPPHVPTPTPPPEPTPPTTPQQSAAEDKPSESEAESTDINDTTGTTTTSETDNEDGKPALEKILEEDEKNDADGSAKQQ